MKNNVGRDDRYHSLMRINSISSNILHYINPWMPLWWSAAFPGFGHFLIGSSLEAYIFVCFEFIVNNMAHVNEAIYRSMIGDINGAREVLNLRWFFGYIGVYIFAMYDSYRRTVEYNKVYLLSYRYTRKISFAALSPMDHNALEKTSPVNGLFWSFITPGLGAVFIYRIPTLIFALTWWGVTTVKSRWLEAIYYSAIGEFSRATEVLEPQWLLFVPSIMGFAMYYSYRETAMANKQFNLSQAQYLREAYQSKKFIKPV